MLANTEMANADCAAVRNTSSTWRESMGRGDRVEPDML